MRLPSYETGFDLANSLNPARYRDNAGSLSRPRVPVAAEFWRLPSLGLSASFWACPSRCDCAMRTSTLNAFLLNSYRRVSSVRQ
jgi:hypothetical protein